MNNILIPAEPRIVCPEDPSYVLPLSISDQIGLTPQDEELIVAMAMYAPKTRLRGGDICELTTVPLALKRRYNVLPRFWEVRFVISAWAYESMAAIWKHGGELGMDRLFSILAEQHGFHETQYRSPVIYAHGHPHGRNPDSAVWLPERVLRRTVVREHLEPWRSVIEHAGARYAGYDPSKMPSRFHFSLAPDNYSSGSNIGKPFNYEEATAETMHAMGLGEFYDVPLIVGGKKTARVIDRDHDVYAD